MNLSIIYNLIKRPTLSGDVLMVIRGNTIQLSSFNKWKNTEKENNTLK